MSVVVYSKLYESYGNPYIKKWDSRGIFNWVNCQSEAYKFDSESDARETIKRVYPTDPYWLNTIGIVRFIPIS